MEGVGGLIEPARPGQSINRPCRACGRPGLEILLSLGEQPLANALRPIEAADTPEQRFPLEAAFCAGCSLVQLTVSVAPELLFNEYPYFSSYSDTVVANALVVVERCVRSLRLGADDLAVEIASNDGYLLQFYRHAGVPVLGIDPAANVAAAAERRGIPTRCEFFGEVSAERLRRSGQRASVLHANNVLAHVPDVGGVLRGIARVLRDDGRAMIETPYVADLVDRVEFDTIYHEHLFYYSVTSLCRLLAANGLALVDVERLPIHGGSLRAVATLPGVAERRPAVDALLDEEARRGLVSGVGYREFSARVDSLCVALREILADLRAQGRRVAGYGAAAKATVLLNTLGVDIETIEFVADRNPHKHGKLIPGTRIPIVSAEQLLERRPDDTVLFSWNFAEEVLAQQSEYRARGGRFLIPIPEPHTV